MQVQVVVILGHDIPVILLYLLQCYSQIVQSNDPDEMDGAVSSVAQVPIFTRLNLDAVSC